MILLFFPLVYSKQNLHQQVRKLSDVIIYVSNENELRNAINDDTSIELTSNIYVNNTIVISNITSLEINGNGFAIDGQSKFRCLNITSSTLVFLHNMTVSNGTTAVRLYTYICLSD